MRARLCVSAAAILIAAFCASIVSAEEIQKARETKPANHLKASPAMKRLDLPASFDWRFFGKVTPVKNQGEFGTCWVHAALGDLESKVLIRESVTYDFSELNVVACNNHGTTGYTGGIADIAANYLSVFASVLEACNPYPGDLPYPACVNPACDFYKTVTEWILLPNDIDAIKAAIYTYGPVQGAVHTDAAYYAYSGTGCLTGPNDQANHHILIVGWDDTMCSAGAWIIKESYGTGWGDNGFGYVAYNNYSIQSHVNSYTDYKNFSWAEMVLHYDEQGWMNEAGYGDGIDWGLVMILTPAVDTWLHAVNFWAVWSPIEYTLKIYDSFNGTVPSDLLAGPITGTIGYAGLRTIDLPKIVPVTAGDPLYIDICFNGLGYAYPIPVDDAGIMETNRSFVSNTGSSYIALDAGQAGIGDIGIRARISSSVERGDPAFYSAFGADTIDAYPGQVLSMPVSLVNFGFLGGVCSEPDTICLHTQFAPGWNIYGAVETPLFIDLFGTYGYNIYMDIPCTAVPGATNMLTAYTSYWDDGACMPGWGDCENPNMYGGDSYYSSKHVVIRIVEHPSPLMVQSDCDTSINVGQNPQGVPFNIYNNNPCAPVADIHYAVTSCGHVGDAIYQTGTAEDVPSGDYKTVYAVLDASESIICDRDTLTMICWNTPATCYDTCVQVVHVTEYTDAFEPDELPAAFSLVQNHPNPFNPATEISYQLPNACHVKLEIFDVRGRRVATLIDRYEEAGYRTVSWDGRGSDGSQLASGVYFYRITAGEFNDSKKMILLR